MVNLSETLFALAAVGALVTLALFVRRRHAYARRLGFGTLALLSLAVFLELYLQLFA